MSFTLLLFDLDGTLLDPTRQIRPATREVLGDLMATGLRVGFATGRSHVSIGSYAEALGPNGPCVLFNGAMVWDPLTARVVHERRLTDEVALAALKLAAELGIHVNLYIGGEIFVCERSATSMESEHKDGVVHRAVGDLGELLASQRSVATKLLLIEEAGDFAVFEERFAAAAADATLVHSEPTYLEILPPGTNKGAGLSVIASAFGIGAREVMAFGDELNDLELIAAAGLGVAMGNGQPRLKEIADVVIGPNDTDAIAQFLREGMRVAGGRLERCG